MDYTITLDAKQQAVMDLWIVAPGISDVQQALTDNANAFVKACAVDVHMDVDKALLDELAKLDESAKQDLLDTLKGDKSDVVEGAIL